MTNGYLFREYIGARFTGVQFSDVPINAFVSFHVILAFAIDYTPVNQQSPPVPTNGVFTPFWDRTNLSPSAVAAIKAAHPNVAVMSGLGGDSVQDITKAFFAPTSIDSWVSNAATSLTGIINTYGLAGVDVDYEHFAPNADVNTFVECIGQLLSLDAAEAEDAMDYHVHRAIRGPGDPEVLPAAVEQVLRRDRLRQLPVLRLRR
ncbi:unnamed protein product [Urochloa humidicola]